ncbi:WXG100 family type VII secretion target [Nonomuraea jiangxiensis]|uniref:WXG100 family type VII secretion target n=1 Tax=Nonomuraea jiangxiensis TaxID=633440 RepID=A0A1G8FJ21_9ACTN|nr:WXG100 family type VII secretion target [Nonomuraea jiangxiensis]SDH82107.1 WXG100 family type VII secretion target [Nonomuraea jiangxiensis]
MAATPDDYTYVKFPSMEVAYEELKKVITELDKATDDLYADIKRELGASWEGEAERYFDVKREQWNQHEKAMGQQLFQAAEAVSIAKGNYESAERRNISIWTD